MSQPIIELLSDVKHIILFYSEGCGHCHAYKETRWPNLAKAAQECGLEVSEVDVDYPGEGAHLMKYNKSDGIPNTVFMCGKKILASNAGNFDTRNLIKALKSEFLDNVGPTMGYHVEYRR